MLHGICITSDGRAESGATWWNVGNPADGHVKSLCWEQVHVQLIRDSYSQRLATICSAFVGTGSIKAWECKTPQTATYLTWR
jgi:hypothetical protein